MNYFKDFFLSQYFKDMSYGSTLQPKTAIEVGFLITCAKVEIAVLGGVWCHSTSSNLTNYFKQLLAGLMLY